MIQSIRKIFFGLFVASTALVSCEEEGNPLAFLDAAEAPSNVSAIFDITQDNTGRVTITPIGEGVANFEVLPGDGTATSQVVKPGQSWAHVYKEGEYNVRIKAIGMTGLSTESTQKLKVSFRAPENLVVSIQKDPVQTKTVFVTAKADFATSFEVLFGDDPSALPQVATIGSTIAHTYVNDGTYTIKVTAKSGGVATTSYSEVVTVTGRTLPDAPAHSAGCRPRAPAAPACQSRRRPRRPTRAGSGSPAPRRSSSSARPGRAGRRASAGAGPCTAGTSRRGRSGPGRPPRRR